MEITARKTAIQSTVSLFKYTITLFIFLYQCQNPARQGYNQNDHRDDSHDPEDFCLSYRLILHASCKSFWVDRHEKGNGKTDRIQNNTYPKFHRCSATQNMFKYTQTHREIKVLADTSYCFNVYALAIINNTLLTSSCTLHSRKFLR